MNKNGYLLLLLSLLFVACTNKKSAPDISGVKVDLKVDRFDERFFSLDTNNLESGLAVLQHDYPQLLNPYLGSVLGVTDAAGIKTFIRLYKPVFDSTQRLYKDFNGVQKDMEKAFRYVKHYFPQYETPAKLIPVVGPMNSLNDLAKMANGELTPNFIGPGFVGISLQFYLGENFSLYQDEYFINNVVPLYRSRRFTRDYMAGDIMKLITDDLFPDKSATRPLIEQMIEKGKRWWLADKFLPAVPDHLKIGYTKEQIAWCEENEGLIWSFIVKNENLHTVDPVTIQNYIGEAPFTQGFSQEHSPGNLGPWIGWQIVKKYESLHPDLDPAAIMQAAAQQILAEAKYKPK